MMCLRTAIRAFSGERPYARIAFLRSWMFRIGYDPSFIAMPSLASSCRSSSVNFANSATPANDSTRARRSSALATIPASRTPYFSRAEKTIAYGSSSSDSSSSRYPTSVGMDEARRYHDHFWCISMRPAMKSAIPCSLHESATWKAFLSSERTYSFAVNRSYAIA